MRPGTFLLLILSMFGWAAIAPAAPSTQPELLGPLFRSPANGIALRPPIRCDKVIAGIADQIVEFDDDAGAWSLKVSRRSFEQPLPLTYYKDQYGGQHEGLLELTLKPFMDQRVAQLVTHDVIHIGPGGKTSAGEFVLRYDRNLERRLRQEALIEANNQLYYILELDTPARPNPDNGVEDPAERQASDTFNAILDSVQLLDRSVIYQDQADRFIRTRGLQANWTPGYLASRLVTDQYFRLVRDGKEIGYSYEVEELVDDKAGRIADTPVIRIDMRSATTPQDGTDVQVQSRLTMTTDRKHEEWVNMATINAAPTADKKTGSQTLFSEVGTSVERVRIAAAVPVGGGLAAAQQPNAGGAPGNSAALQMKESWTLNVVRSSTDLAHPDEKQDYPPFKQDLPAFYIPQALGHLLPRLLPVDDPQTYLFATYVPDGDHGTPAVMLRYIDVLPAAQVRLEGKTIIAVQVKDHIGLEGPVTTHYLNPDDGAYLGSVTSSVDKDGNPTTEMVLPTDAATLRKIWPQCNLTRPDSIVDAKPPQ
jgi:hypothetical protein